MPHLPNVLILLVDTARAQNFSCYGYKRPTSPHIDTLATEGVLYEQAIAPGCWSLPSQVSLLSGMLPSTHGAHELHLSYAHTYPLLPEVLREAGYHTIGVSPNSWMSDEFGVTYGFDMYLKLWQWRYTLPAAATDGAGPLLALSHTVNRFYSHYVFPHRNRARHVRWHIDKLLATTPEPYFLYAIFWDMHLPYYPARRHATRWLPSGISSIQTRRVNRNPLRYFTDQVPMTEEDFAVLRAWYDSALATVDEEIGTLVAHLRQRGVLDHTVLIITSDHGENIGEHGLMSHAYSLHDTLIRVPLIIRYPACFPPGHRVTHQVQLTDLFPTLLDVLHLDVPTVRQALQGLSLVSPNLEASEERLAYAEMLAPHPSIQALNRRVGMPEHTPRPRLDRALRCLRAPDCKIIWASDGYHALYDLRHDPGETVNRFATHPELAAELMESLQALSITPSSPLNQSVPTIDQNMRRHLRDLGYID